MFHGEVQGKEQLVTGDDLQTLFSVLKDQIRVVVLNACYSDEQALAIGTTIDFVVGMSDSIDDPAAIKFAAAFYRGLGFGRSVQTAFDLGVSEMKLAGHANDAPVPVLLSPGGVDPASTVLLRRRDRK